MANTFLTNTMLAEHALAHFINNCQYIRLANRDYEKDYRSTNGFMPGATINILKPTYLVPRQGATASVQNIQERQTSLTLSFQDGQDVAISSFQYATQLEIGDFNSRLLEAIIIPLANLVDTRIDTELRNAVYNASGTATTPLNSFSSFNSWKTQLRKRGVEGRYNAVLNEEDGTDLENSLQNAFNRTLNEEISIYGRLGELADVGVYRSQNVLNHTVGTYTGTPLVNTASQTGSSLITDGWVAGDVLNLGDIFYISNGTPVRSTNPVSLSAIGNTTADLQRFVVTATSTADGGGNMTIPISPAITVTGPYQNVTNSPSDNAALSIVGASASSYRNNYMFVDEGVSIAIVPMVDQPGAVNVARVTDPRTNISMRVIDYYDGTNDVGLKRFDILYGIKIFPEYVTRLVAGG